MLGLEIGSANIKLLECTIKGKNYIVENSKIMEIPIDTISDGIIKDVKGLTAVLKKEIKEKKYKSKNLGILIESSKIITRDIRIDKMPFKDLKAILEIQYPEYLLIDISTYQVTFKVLREVETSEGIEEEVLIVAAPNKLINPLIEIADNLRLRIKSINIVSDAVANLFREDSFTMDMKEKSALVIDIGAISTTATIISGGVGVLNKNIKFGLKGLAQKIPKYFESSQVENELALEIGQLLQFHFSRGQYEAIEKIYLVGGGADLENIAEYMSNLFGIPCAIGVTLDITQIETNEEVESKSHYFANLLGLINEF